MKISLRINGQPHEVAAPPRRTLAEVLRDDLGLTGTKLSCGEGECGACTVLMDDVPVTACLVLAAQAQGKDITTIEGLGADATLSAVQQAFVAEQGFQCGACTPGFVMAAHAFLAETPAPTLAEATAAMSGNICRCGAHPYIVRAVMRAAEMRSAGQGA